MSGFFILVMGPIKQDNPDPFFVQSLDEVFQIITNHLAPRLDVERDSIWVYELPVESGRAKIVWEFCGLYGTPSSHTARRGDISQGKLPGHALPLYNELLVSYVDECDDLLEGPLYGEQKNEEVDILLDQLLDDPQSLPIRIPE